MLNLWSVVSLKRAYYENSEEAIWTRYLSPLGIRMLQCLLGGYDFFFFLTYSYSSLNKYSQVCTKSALNSSSVKLFWNVFIELLNEYENCEKLHKRWYKIIKIIRKGIAG